MQHRFRTDIGRKSILCVDSYENGVLQGRLYTPFREMETFSSLSQFLLKMEDLLDQQNSPQPYTMPRSFSELPTPRDAWIQDAGRQGHRATFEIRVLFRQHSSWQGSLYWAGKNVQQQFRSVLELVILLDSALTGHRAEETNVYSGRLPGEQNRPPAV